MALTFQVGLFSATVALMGAMTPAAAGTHTVYMTSSDTCVYDCVVAVMQVKGDKVRYKIAHAMADGISSIGWMTRTGNRVTGVAGSDCSKSRVSRVVAGRGANTHFEGMQVTSRKVAETFESRHPHLGLTLPTWPWVTPKQWRANYQRYCG